jgi:hypothetical protein
MQDRGRHRVAVSAKQDQRFEHARHHRRRVIGVVLRPGRRGRLLHCLPQRHGDARGGRMRQHGGKLRGRSGHDWGSA